MATDKKRRLNNTDRRVKRTKKALRDALLTLLKSKPINQISVTELTTLADVNVKLKVKNTGDVAGDEVVQIYVEDCESSVVTPLKLLKDFKRVTLQAGETAEVEFNLDYMAFRLMNQAYEWVVEPGKFNIFAASSSRDIRLSGEVTL